MFKTKKEGIFPLLHKNKIQFFILSFLVVLLSIISLFTGAYDITKEGGWDMFFITRIPRTIALLLTSIAMSLSGLVMQLMTQNKFVEPTTTGTIEWAGLGLIFSYIFFNAPSLLTRMSFAILFSFIGTMIFFLFLRKLKLKSSLMVPIIGIMLGAIISAVSTFVGLLFSMTQSLEIWFQGSFAPVQRGRYEYLFLILIVVFIIYILADRLTVVGLGKDMATNLGIDYEKIVLIATTIISFAVGIVSSVIGNLPFLGLIVPNIVSMYKGDNTRENIVWVMLFSMAIILICDILSRSIIKPFEVPVSLILGLVGSAVFLYLILQRRRK
ncbi:MAG: iron chelate uptake ABC transporter family permease subunit [Tissierellia bacterium]|nr:iron chelate uptake ABC transporter family permease subunit [Tissierellia bacterium]